MWNPQPTTLVHTEYCMYVCSRIVLLYSENCMCTERITERSRAALTNFRHSYPRLLTEISILSTNIARAPDSEAPADVSHAINLVVDHAVILFGKISNKKLAGRSLGTKCRCSCLFLE